MTTADELLARLDTTDDALPLLARLTPGEVAALDRAVAEAMRSEDDAFERGMRGALDLVPRPLRGVARGLLFPRAGRG